MTRNPDSYRDCQCKNAGKKNRFERDCIAAGGGCISVRRSDLLSFLVFNSGYLTRNTILKVTGRYFIHLYK